MRRTSAPGRGPSGRFQRPAVESPVTDSARPAFASSSATQPPSELPATCARSMPSRSRKAATDAGEELRRRLGAVRQRGRPAEAGQVDRDHVALAGKQVEQRLPHDELAAERMDEDERLAAAAADVVEHAGAQLRAQRSAARSRRGAGPRYAGPASSA